ncbi:glycosyltransferase family 4 protein [Puia dinghuensis]|nr:glycosyltransferase family 4 protein [Puia dinghuensis]
MKKVLILNSSSRIGGAERSLIDLLLVLQKKIHLSVILPEETELFFALQCKYSTTIVPMPLIKRREGYFKQLLSIITAARKISRRINSERINYVYANTNQSFIYAIFIRLLTGKKVFWHIRDNLPNRLAAFCLGLFANKIICVSYHIYKQIPLNKKKKVIIYNGIDTRIWDIRSAPAAQLRKELELPLNKIIIAQIGSLVPWKNHMLLIEIAQRLIIDNKDVHFLIAGRDLFNDYPGYSRHLLQTIRLAGIEDYFTFPFYLEDNKTLLSGIDILVHLSRGEPFGRVLIEAMALEKPVVALREGGPIEIVADEASGYLIDKPDPETIAEKLYLLTQFGDLRNKMGKEGRRIVETKFNIDNLEKIEKHLNQWSVASWDLFGRTILHRIPH